MNFRHQFTGPFFLGIMLFICPVWGQEPEKPPNRRNSWIIHHLSNQDVILTVSSIEWGHPDRWSFTSRYIHSFHATRARRTWNHNLFVSISPGTAGGRLAVGYMGLLTPMSMREFGLFSEARFALLRTWRTPFCVPAKRTFAGIEIRFGLGGVINLGFGKFVQVSDVVNSRERFWSVHAGVGI